MIMKITNKEKIMGTLEDSFISAIQPTKTIDIPKFTEEALAIYGVQKLG